MSWLGDDPGGTVVKTALALQGMWELGILGTRILQVERGSQKNFFKWHNFIKDK